MFDHVVDLEKTYLSGIPCWHTRSMSLTTLKIDTALRDRLASIARTDYDGDTLAGALEKLIEEHEQQRALDAYERLRSDPDAWSEYQEELRLTDHAASDGLGNAREEYPEYH
jgi:hypothetical protein